MNTQTKITWFAFLLAMFGLSYWMIAQSNVKAMEEIVSTYNRIQELSGMIEEEQTAYRIAEESKIECMTSWEQQKDIAHKNADKYRAEKSKLEGLLKSSQAQKKINLNTAESWYIMTDTVEKTEDNKWYKRLLKWVGWN